MFILSVALLALGVVFALFGFVGVAGQGAIAGSVVLLFASVVAMLGFWQRRAVEE